MQRASEVCAVIEVELNKQMKGRPREWTARGMLTAFLLVARHEQGFFIDRGSDLIATLPAATRERLELNRPDGRPFTTRQISYAWNRISRSIDPAGHDLTDAERQRRLELLTWVNDELLWATTDREFRRQWKGDAAVDATLVWAHGRPPLTTNHKLYAGGSDGDGMRTSKRVELLSDHDYEFEKPTRDHPFLGNLRPAPYADEERHQDSGRRRRRDRGNKAIGASWIGNPSISKVVYGYAHHIAVAVPTVGGTLPALAIGHVTSPTTSHPALTALPMFADIRQRRLNDPDRDDADPALGDILADGGYSQARAEHWSLPIRQLGAQPVFQLHSGNQLGHRGALEGHPGGYLLVDGRYYCPCLPESLRHATYPRFGKHTDPQKMKDEFRSVLAQREPYELRSRGRNRGTGLRFSTPHNGTACPSCGTDGCCETKFVTVTWDQLGLYQQHRFGSLEWEASYNRRPRVEGFFGMLKSPTVGRHNRNTSLFFEYAKNALSVTFAAMATNLHVLANWHADRVEGRKKRHRPGRPRINPTLAEISEDPAVLGDSRQKKRRKRQRPPRANPPPSNPFADLGAPRS